MRFSLSTVFVALAAVAATTASPATPPNAVTCSFVLIPEVPIDASTTNLQAEFNFAIGRALGEAVPSHETFSGNATWVEVEVDNGSVFHVDQTIAAIGLPKDQTAAIMNGWVGTTLESLVTNWFVNAAGCA